MSGLISLEEAQARLLALAPVMPVIDAAPHDPLIRILAADLTARRTQPDADLCAMDGYAVCGAGPWQRIGEARAGAALSGVLEAGQCARISTGAALPAGAELVLIQENAVVDGDRVTLAPGEAMPSAGQHVRRRGFDFAAGDTLLRRGARMGPAQWALAIAGGHDTAPVRAAPSVTVLDSGDELAASAATCASGQLPASNGAMIAAMLAPWVGEVRQIGPVADDLDALAKALASVESDILITSGGASVGDHDLIRPALAQWGSGIDFWRVAVKPGKPLLVATREAEGKRQVIVGLPGNPVSSFVTAFLFTLPLVRAALGDAAPLPRPERRIAGEDLPATGNRREFLRAVDDGERVHLAGSQDSSALLALAAATCLIDRPPRAAAVSAGEAVAVYNLHNSDNARAGGG